VKSLARPDGNVTGVFFQQIELAVKRVELLKDDLCGCSNSQFQSEFLDDLAQKRCALRATGHFSTMWRKRQRETCCRLAMELAAQRKNTHH
jgi:hypothetical protein